MIYSQVKIEKSLDRQINNLGKVNADDQVGSEGYAPVPKNEDCEMKGRKKG